ncbi:hypothetical protein IIA95_03275 [Patescibacteria group bacterium]|nr:hypothetical protein [Patescibacteria group bacterium]
MLPEKLQRVKSWITGNEGDLVIAVSFIFVALIGFGLGRLSALGGQKIPLRIDYPKEVANPNVKFAAPVHSDTRSRSEFLVGSKNSDKYHFPWCPGASRIKEANKIQFSSREEAEKLGYKPAANCRGL